jgi:hypothetical protein
LRCLGGTAILRLDQSMTLTVTGGRTVTPANRRAAARSGRLPGTAENTTNRAVEDAAIAFVLEHERRHGRDAHDTRGRGAPVDVRSDGRSIEVKAYGRSARGLDLWLEPSQVEAARTDPAFHLYVVENVRQGDPAAFRLIDLHGDRLARPDERSRERRYFVVPLPTAEYEAAVAELEA